MVGPHGYVEGSVQCVYFWWAIHCDIQQRMDLNFTRIKTEVTRTENFVVSQRTQKTLKGYDQ